MNSRVLELAGPSGAGKSTVYRYLSASTRERLTPIVRHIPGLIYHSRVYWLLAPLILWKFRALCLAIVHAQGPGAVRPTATMVNFLSWVTARYLVAVVQARIKRKIVMVDEGFVQAGLGLAARLGDPFSNDWDAYISALPKSTWYALFQCPSDVAASRAIARPAGPPVKMRTLLDATGLTPEEALTGTNEQCRSLLDSIKRADRLTCFSVDGELPVAECASQLSRAIATADIRMGRLQDTAL